MLAVPAGSDQGAVTAPGAQGRLFTSEGSSAQLRFVVVDADGARTPPVGHLGTAAAQAHAAARTAGRSWIEGTDGRTVEISIRDDRLVVAPREPGWPASIARLMTEQAIPHEEDP